MRSLSRNTWGVFRECEFPWREVPRGGIGGARGEEESSGEEWSCLGPIVALGWPPSG
jgi:hypothetical protein